MPPSRVTGVGLDLVDIDRFERMKPRVRERLFTKAEAKYCILQRRPALHFAARFAAKEAVLKALGTGWSGGISWTEVEIVREEHGSVDVSLSGVAAKTAKRLKVRAWHISMTHTSSTAAAVAIAQS